MAERDREAAPDAARTAYTLGLDYGTNSVRAVDFLPLCRYPLRLGAIGQSLLPRGDVLRQPLADMIHRKRIFDVAEVWLPGTALSERAQKFQANIQPVGVPFLDHQATDRLQTHQRHLPGYGECSPGDLAPRLQRTAPNLIVHIGAPVQPCQGLPDLL